MTNAEPKVPVTNYRPLRFWIFRGLLYSGGLLVLMLLLTTVWGYWRLRGSLPKLDGTLEVAGLSAQGSIERDAQGVPTIEAQTRSDTAYLLGFSHAQDRFFQMDLLRRMSGGRLSELVGQAAIPNDTRFRKHRFQQLAEEVVGRLPKPHAELLTAYTAGINEGLRRLNDVPFEYLLLRQTPEPWKETDSILVMMTMQCDLQPMDGSPELGFGVLSERVPPVVFDFLVRGGSRWDAALDDSKLPQPAVPAADQFTMRGSALAEIETQFAADDSLQREVRNPFFSPLDVHDEFRVGSNNWAVSKSVGRDGRAILASDMHLGLRVPTIWYRVLMKTPTIQGDQRSLVGVTLPGTPVLIEGSNGSVAWGFTNSYGDYGDIVELKPAKEQGDDHYLTARGPQKLERYSEQIAFPGGAETIEYEWSIWGPVVETRDGRRFVHRWVGNDPAAFDLNLIDLEGASDVSQTLDLANRAGMPNQNVTVTDSQGNIGWTISGRIPRRPDAPSLLPVDWSSGAGEWQGYLKPEEYPRVINPPEGRLWTANNRIMGGDYLTKVGDGRFDPGARASQIRDRLREKETLGESDLLAIQLDDEARFMRTWRERLLRVSSLQPGLISEELIRHVNESSDRASVDAIGYRIVSEYRLQTLERIFGFATSRRDVSSGQELRGLAKRIGIRRSVLISRDDVAEQLLTEQPAHWLPGEYKSWDELLMDAAVGTERELTRRGPLTEARWGVRNRAAIRHPLSQALPFLSRWLDMPEVELPGDNHLPRVQSPAGGASQRMVVSPGEEAKGYYHQPGGQSGHPLSPYYHAGFDDWANGHPSPLLPGPTRHRLVLTASASK